MRYLLLCFVLLTAHRSLAQNDTTWFNKYWDTTTKANAMYFRPAAKKLADGQYRVRDYYVSTGNIQEDGFSLDSTITTQCGLTKHYYENGALESIGNTNGIGSDGDWKIYYRDSGKLKSTRFLKNGIYLGPLIVYYKNGVIKRKEIWKRGIVKEGHCYDSNGKEVAYFEDNSVARFPGGDKLYAEYILDRMTYPEYCKKNKIHGRVYIDAYFDATGKIYKTKIITKIHPLLDAEALRLIESMPAWQPAVDDDGKFVECDRYLDILFGKD